ncbi:Homeobox domain-containing protein [Meloidogyne graminicola]|uniref:Homeobox domain-containing protein n=1 Tax=Meloidogyne graminicola TaxID=189291 RepID=A0A8T0A4D6_9BILA|nr:Homeobox domain-containing protein [Meloidogyne graminicola]
MKGEGNDGTNFIENTLHSNNQTEMFSHLPSTSNSSMPFNLWENQQWQNYWQQQWTNYRYPFHLQNDFCSSNTNTMNSKNTFHHSPLSTINIFAGYPVPPTLPAIGQQFPNTISYENNQIDAVNPWLLSAPKVCVSVNPYSLESRINNNITTTITTKTKNEPINNNERLNLSLPQSIPSNQQISRQRFGPGTNNLRVRTKDQYRIVYNEYQRIELERAFVSGKYVSTEVKAELSSRLHLTERQIKIWFQNRRAKERKQENHLKNMKIKQKQQQQHTQQNMNNTHF